MNIVIDIGNSYVKVYNQNKKYLVFPNTKDYYIKSNIEQLLDLDEIEVANICSVVPEVTDIVVEALSNNNIKINILTSSDFGKLIDFGSLDHENMGSDRVITTFSAKEKYGDNIIVFDLGTAITVDVLVDATYKSGYIIPGSELQKKILIAGASMIDELPFQKVTRSFEALDTNSQISDGILLGICGSINSLRKICSNLFESEYKVILTGGTTKQIQEFVGETLMKELIDCELIIDHNLMADGLFLASKIIWE